MIAFDELPTLALDVLAVVDDTATIALMERTLASGADRLSVARTLTEGLARAAAECPDLVLLDVALGRSAGLAVVHHVRAVAPTVAVYALAHPGALDLGTQAVALGGAGLLMLPLSGDELLTAVNTVRERRAEREVRRELEAEARRNARAATLAARLVDLAGARTVRAATERLVELLVRELSATAVAVYLPASEGSRQLMRAAAFEAEDAPHFSDELGALGWAAERRAAVLRLDLPGGTQGLLLVAGVTTDDRPLPLGHVIAGQVSTSLALIGERERAHRGAMKDPGSSAYTFAYFVDVAGREIDNARRHGRRFSLATLALDLVPASGVPARRSSDGSDPPADSSKASLMVAERVLAAVRDTDVLARVDDDEFYLLLSETGGTGAHVCRRRVLSEVGGAAGPGVIMGVATYPHDGSDLSQLLRVAKVRAEQSRVSVLRTLQLGRLELGELLDSLFWEGPSGEAAGIDGPRAIELPVADLMHLASSVASEAARGGSYRIVCTTRAGVSVGNAVRAALGREPPGSRLDVISVEETRGARDLEALAVVAEHGAYALLGRVEGGLVRAVHAADPLLVDRIVERLGQLSGARLFD